MKDLETEGVVYSRIARLPIDPKYTDTALRDIATAIRKVHRTLLT